MKYDSIIVLSQKLIPDRELSEEPKLRVERVTELFKADCANYVIMNGGPGKFTEKTPYGEFIPRGFHLVQCEVMRDYAMGLGIPKKRILMQSFSSDTIGEAYFVKKMLLAPNK
jgi:uncharacterized SAM-binding protein YcdF (DUF218 family)